MADTYRMNGGRHEKNDRYLPFYRNARSMRQWNSWHMEKY